MKKLRRSILFRYSTAIAIVALSVLVTLGVRQYISLNPTPFILAAIAAAAWYGGLWPGILSAILWSLIGDFFVGPRIVFAIRLDSGDLARFLVLVFIAVLVGRLRRASDLRKMRARQQEVIAELGQRALGGADRSALMNDAVMLVSKTLEVTHSAIVELMPEENLFLICAGVGWKPGIVGRTKISAGEEYLVGYTLKVKEPLIVKDIRSENRFRAHPGVIEQKIISSLTVIIHGPERPFGVFGVYSTRKSKFTKDDINFVQAVANVLSMAIERKRNEENLENQQRWLESALNLMPTPLVFIEPGTAKVTFANRAADHMTGGEFPKGKPAEEYHTVYFATDSEGKRIPDEEMPGVRAARGERLEGFQMDWHTANGKRSIMVSSDTLPAMHGHAATVVMAFQDVTDLKRIEAELHRASRLKDEFLATVSHELRTPLNAMLGWARMLRGGRLDDQTTTRALETIERNAKSQAQIIEDLLDVSRIITGQLRLDVTAVELGQVIEPAIDSLRPAIEAKNIRLQTVLDSQSGPVLGDAGRLQQVVWNLLSNAVKFTPKGGRIQVSLGRVNSQVEIVVSDTGPGISPEFLPFVFDRFRQADSTMTRVHGGLGLGLSIVRHLVELHGGTVSAYNNAESSGTTFRVKLPLLIARGNSRFAAPDQQLAKDDIEARAMLEMSSLTGIRLLVVDDDSDARELLASMLGHSGAEVTTVGSTDEAMEAFSATRPDVLISDIEMPGRDGYELIKEIRRIESESGGWIPAIALTAHARTEDRLRALSAGYQSHIAKPVEPAELVAAVASLARRNLKPTTQQHSTD